MCIYNPLISCLCSVNIVYRHACTDLYAHAHAWRLCARRVYVKVVCVYFNYHICILLWDQERPTRPIMSTRGSTPHLEAADSDEAALRRYFRNAAAKSSCYWWSNFLHMFQCQIMMSCFFWWATLDLFDFRIAGPMIICLMHVHLVQRKEKSNSFPGQDCNLVPSCHPLAP